MHNMDMSFQEYNRMDSLGSSWQPVNNKNFNLTIDTSLADRSNANSGVDPSAISMDSSAHPLSSMWPSPFMDPQGDYAISPKTLRQHGQYTPPEDAALPKLDEITSQDDDASPMFESRQTSSERTHAQQSNHRKVPAKRRRKSVKGDTEEQGDEQREEFLARNRLAASKSRQKKKEWTHGLENRLRNHQAENTHLKFTVDTLRAEVLQLKNLCLQHNYCGCEQIREYLKRSLPGILNSAGPKDPSPTRPSTQDAAFANQAPAHFSSCSSHSPTILQDGDLAGSSSNGSVTARKPSQSLSSMFNNLDDSDPLNTLSTRTKNQAMPSMNNWPSNHRDSIDSIASQPNDDEALRQLWDESVVQGSGDFETGHEGYQSR
jgi:hypothetical protein